MSLRSPGKPRNRIALVLAEAALAAAVIATGSWMDRGSRGIGPEAPVEAYAAALAREDLQGALQQLDPAIRANAASFVEWQLGNRYRILESAVRTPSALDRLTGAVRTDTAVAVTMEIHESGQASWQATAELKVEQLDGHWYLLRPPLQP